VTVQRKPVAKELERIESYPDNFNIAKLNYFHFSWKQKA